MGFLILVAMGCKFVIRVFISLGFSSILVDGDDKKKLKKELIYGIFENSYNAN